MLILGFLFWIIKPNSSFVEDLFKIIFFPLPEILKLLKLTMEDIRGDLKELINSFKFTANNVVFKPEEWNLLAIIILKIISERNDRVKTALVGEEQKKYLTLVL